MNRDLAQSGTHRRTIETRGLRRDLTGEHFSRLFIVSLSHRTKDHVYWVAACSCGSISYPSTSNLNSGSKSCGCLTVAATRRRLTKHGNTKTRLHRIWVKMRARCYDQNDTKKYAYYGARGIRVCDEWRKDFKAFRSWALSNGYAEHLSIDRRDNDGNYEPGNCRWATPSEQMSNTRRSKRRP